MPNAMQDVSSGHEQRQDEATKATAVAALTEMSETAARQRNAFLTQAQSWRESYAAHAANHPDMEPAAAEWMLTEARRAEINADIRDGMARGYSDRVAAL